MIVVAAETVFAEVDLFEPRFTLDRKAIQAAARVYEEKLAISRPVRSFDHLLRFIHNSGRPAIQVKDRNFAVITLRLTQ